MLVYADGRVSAMATSADGSLVAMVADIAAGDSVELDQALGPVMRTIRRHLAECVLRG